MTSPTPSEERDGLVEWLQERAADPIIHPADILAPVRFRDCATEITRLRAEVERMREALKPFADSCIDVSGTAAIGVSQGDIDRARAARMPAEGRAALEQEGA